MCRSVGEYSRLGVHSLGLYGKNLLNNLRGHGVLAPLVPTPMWQAVLVTNTCANCFIDSCLYLNMFLPIVGKKHSRLHCGLCAGCQWSDCGLCINCKDMKKFGGPAKKKKACKLRICSQSSIVKSTESPINEVDVTIKKLNAVVDKFRKLATY